MIIVTDTQLKDLVPFDLRVGVKGYGTLSLWGASRRQYGRDEIDRRYMDLSRLSKNAPSGMIARSCGLALMNPFLQMRRCWRTRGPWLRWAIVTLSGKTSAQLSTRAFINILEPFNSLSRFLTKCLWTIQVDTINSGCVPSCRHAVRTNQSGLRLSTSSLSNPKLRVDADSIHI